ncbi:unnamed protein product, partial [Prorocentrum cordatum]
VAGNGLAAARAEPDAAQSELCTVRKCFEAVVGDSELADRIAALAPALSALLRGGAPSAEEVLRRNVALHADAPEGVSTATASCEDLRRLQKSDRLEGRQFTERGFETRRTWTFPWRFASRNLPRSELETLSSDGGDEVAAAIDAWDPDAAPPETVSSDGSDVGAIAEALDELSWSAMVE